MFALETNVETLETTEGDSIPCIGTENLDGILQGFGIVPKGVNIKY